MSAAAGSMAPGLQGRGVAGLASALVAGVAMATVVPMLLGEPPTPVHLLVGLLAALCLWPVAHAATTGGDLFEPLPAVGGAMFVYFPLRSLYLLHVDHPVEHVPRYLGTDFAEVFPPALLLVAVAWSAAMLGYVLPVGRLLARVAPVATALKQDVPLSRIRLLFLLGLAGKAVSAATGTHLAFASGAVNHETQAWLELLTSFGTMALFLLGLEHFGGRLTRRDSLLFAGAVLIDLFWGLATGGKLRVLTAVMMVLLAHHYARRRVRLRELAAVALAFAFVVVPLVQQFRSVFADRLGADGFAVGSSAAVLVDAASAAGETENFAATALETTIDRFHGIDSVALAMKMTPQYLPHGDTRLYLLFPVMAIVPRIAWKTKPVNIDVPNWESEYWGQSVASDSSVARTLFGALYIGFGSVGTVLWCFGLGVLWRVLNAYVRRSWGMSSALLHVTLLVGILRIENDLPLIYAGLVRNLVLMLALLTLLTRARSGRRPGQG